jgi:hypothetical protein
VLSSRGLSEGRSLVQRNPTQCVCVRVCVIECDNMQQNTLHLKCVGRSQAKKDRMKEVVK